MIRPTNLVSCYLRQASLFKTEVSTFGNGLLHRFSSFASRRLSDATVVRSVYHKSWLQCNPTRCVRITARSFHTKLPLSALCSRPSYNLSDNKQTVLSPVRTLRNERNLTMSAKAIVEASPSSLQPYLRLIRFDRPIGTWLTFLPSAWSLSLATPVGQLPDLWLTSMFALGAFFMRSAGCIINDMWDKDLDSQVARTRNRPIASGEISRLKAFVFLALPLTASLGILLTLNDNTILLGVFALLPVAVYPLMKRFTYWPQAFLGLTFNFGVLLGWSAVRGVLDWPVLPLYAASIAWTLIYDTIYAFQDSKDDVSAGVKSTALKFGDATKLWLCGFTSVFTAGLTTTGILCEQPWPYYIGVSLFTVQLVRQIYTVDLSSSVDCASKFRSNRNIGLLFWLVVIAAGFSRQSAGNTDKIDSRVNNCDGIETSLPDTRCQLKDVLPAHL